MRDPARIPRLLGQLETIWQRYPDMRLCQLIGNALPDKDIYHVEDDVLELELRRLYSRLEAND